MCRNIKTLFNFDPPATDEEIRAASLQFVRKLSGFTAPSKANEAAFDRAIEDYLPGKLPAARGRRKALTQSIIGAREAAPDRGRVEQLAIEPHHKRAPATK